MDKKSKKVLNYFISHGKDCSYCVYLTNLKELSDYLKMTEINTEALIRNLASEGYLEIKNYFPNGFYAANLTYKGIKYKSYRKADLFHYFSEKWIDFLALIVAVIALIISIAK